MPGWLWTTNPALRTVLSQEKTRLGKSSKGREEHPVKQLYTFHIPIYLKTGPMNSVWSHAILEQVLGGRAEGACPKIESTTNSLSEKPGRLHPQQSLQSLLKSKQEAHGAHGHIILYNTHSGAGSCKGPKWPHRTVLNGSLSLERKRCLSGRCLPAW